MCVIAQIIHKHPVDSKDGWWVELTQYRSIGWLWYYLCWTFRFCYDSASFNTYVVRKLHLCVDFAHEKRFKRCSSFCKEYVYHCNKSFWSSNVQANRQTARYSWKRNQTVRVWVCVYTKHLCFWRVLAVQWTTP